MESCKRMLPTLLLLILLLLSSGMGPEMKVEAGRPHGDPSTGTEETRVCESKSHTFKGLCFSEHNCGHVCQTEGFQYGKCRGARKRCFCTKYC